MEIKSNIRNELFKRNEIEAEVEAEKNPGFAEARKMISEQTKKPEENINVYNIKGKFGSKQFKINAYVYDSKEDLEKAEQKTQKQKKVEKQDEVKGEEEEKPTEEPAERKKEEKPEEPKEEKPAEEEKQEEAKEA